VSIGRDPVSGKWGVVFRVWPGFADDDPTVDFADKALAKLVAETEWDRGGRTPAQGTTVDQSLAKWLKRITSEGRSPTSLREDKRIRRSASTRPSAPRPSPR
jgi:hypothetical protein